MYKCSECEKEYNIKPDYCDCGNDIFIEILEEKPKTVPKAPKKSFEELYPGFASFKNSLDPLSVVIFCICIILSILSLIFIGRGDGVVEEKKEEIAITKKVNTNIESFWDNSLPKVKEAPTPTPIIQTPKIEPPKTVQTVQTKPKAQTQKPQQIAQAKPKAQTQVKSQQVKQTTKTQTTQTKPKQASQTQQTAQTKTSQTAQTKPQQTTNAKIQTQKIEVSTPSQTTTQTPKINIQQTTQTTKKPTQAELQELKNYKTALRNRIFSYIDFTSIVGDGVCVITFTINESGKLTNRKFAQRSASTMLNDAVYNAMLKVPSYKQPPSAYRGETLKFTVQFVAGQYEVSLN